MMTHCSIDRPRRAHSTQQREATRCGLEVTIYIYIYIRGSVIPLSHLCGSSRAVFCGSTAIACRQKAAVVVRKVYDLIAVSTVPSRYSRYIFGFLRFSAVAEPQRTAA